jgi:F0F1-type ATP synthase assembly protein I
MPISTVDESRVHDPIATGRSAALRAVAIQAAAALLVAGGMWLLAGPRQGLAAVAGGLAMLAGNALAAVVALGGGIQSARAAFARLLLGTLGKWVVVMLVLAVALGALRLPALPTLAGLAAGMLAYLLASTRQQR